jgi:hypothetical protein
MSLDNFRSDFRKIDKINQSYIEPLYVKQGDYNGRDLIVQITDGGEVKDQTGVTLNLGWKHESVGNSGLEPFERVDVSQGIFKVSYPTELLNPGRATGVIQIVEGSKIGYTFNVMIVIDKNPVDEDTAVSSNQFTTFQDALIRLENIEDTYDTRLNSIENKNIQQDDDINNLEINKAEISYVDMVIENAISGTPKEVFDTLSQLESTYPSGADGVFLVLDNGDSSGSSYVYFWNGTNWQNAGVYQSDGLAALLTVQNDVWEV